MRIDILTMCPELFGDFQKSPIVSRSIAAGRLELHILDFREFTKGSFRQIDDSPYGGGAGMIIRCQPVLDALASVRTPESHTILLAPIGKPFRQTTAHRYAQFSHLILLCGHYEGFDARIYDHVDELVSIGDYILTGGELAAMVITDAVTRLQKGSLREESSQEESFENGLLEYLQYTRPADYHGQKVPEVLLSGDHEKIAQWRRASSLEQTRKYRPDLLEKSTV